MNITDPAVPFMAISETWLKSYITDAQIKIDNYNSLRSDRSKRKGGGSLLYIHDSLLITRSASHDDEFNNAVICTLDSPRLIIASVYRPPNATSNSLKHLLDFLQEYIHEETEHQSSEVYILGDFNLPSMNWNTFMIDNNQGVESKTSSSLLKDFISKNFLTQLVKDTTRLKNTLDLILTNNDRDVIEINCSETSLSDHKLVECKLGYNVLNRNNHPQMKTQPETSFSTVNVHAANYEDVNKDLCKVDWHELLCLCTDEDDDGSQFLELVRLTMLQLLIKHAPPRNINNHKVKKKDKKRSILYRRKRKLNARLKTLKQHQPNSPTIKNLQDQISLINIDIRDVINDSIAKRERKAINNLKQNPRYFFSYAKKFSKLRSNIGPLRSDKGDLIDSSKDMAELLQKQYCSVFSDPSEANIKESLSSVPNTDSSMSSFNFTTDDIIRAIDELDAYSATSDEDIPAKVLKECKHFLAIPLHMIWKRSLHTGMIPPTLKTQYITPVYKKGNKTDPANYRPISLTSHVIKIFERVMRQNIVEYMEGHSMLTSQQHGFRKGRSCLTQLLDHMDNIFNTLNSGNEVDVIYLDYAKAFDKVDHNILLSKLQRYGFKDNVYAWLKQFLTNRKQTVMINGQKSTYQPVISGVPQGTVLGPILFILYINDLGNVVKSSKVSSFADDTKISHAILSTNCTIELQHDLDAVIKWSDHNNMKLHEQKFELMTYKMHSSSLLDELPFTSEYSHYETPCGMTLEASDTVKDLGVYLSHDCSWTPHINIIADNARRLASWTLGVFKDRSPSTMLTLFKTMIRPRLEYCCPLWNPHKIKDIQTLEDVQRHYTRKILGCQDMNYWERIRHLKMHSLQRRRERYMIIHVWKILNGHTPNDINLVFYTHPRHGIRISLPKFNTKVAMHVSTLFESSFTISSAKLWNILPANVNSQTKLEPFKVALSHILDSYPDTPPTPGYTAVNRNSLIDWTNQSGGRRLLR